MIKYDNHKLPYGLRYVKDGYTIRKTARVGGPQSLEFMRALCKHLIAQPDPLVVPVYSFKSLGDHADGYRYCYDMQRLGILNEDEKQIVWNVGDAWRARVDNPLRYSKEVTFPGKIAISSGRARDEYPELMRYLGKVIKQDRYHDLHGGNVMRDEDGNYLLIDLEGFLNPPISQPSNSWITR